MKQEQRENPLKNYLIALLIVLVVVLLTFYAKKSYELKEERDLGQSILSRVIGEIRYDEIDNVFLETTADYYLYISYNDSSFNSLENKIKTLIANQELQNNFYYLNVNDEKDDSKLISKLNNKFGLSTKKIIKLPAIIYYEDGRFKDLITSTNNKIININEVKEMINK